MPRLHSPSRQPRSADATSFVAIQYEPIAPLGTGGMGAVILARATTGPTPGKLVAIKRLLTHLEREPQFLEAFRDEVWLISSLRHPNVVEPYDWGRDASGSYVVMEFVPGDSLRALLAARTAAQAPLPVNVVAEVIAAAAEGLHAAHELRNADGELLDVVHRDISPANVLVGLNGEVKLIDFGVAHAAGKLSQTASGLIKGKFGYMSPEQVRGAPLDRRSDVFSLGVVAWEALTLCRLYSGASEFDVAQMICAETPIAPSDLRHDVPAELDAIVLSCLAKDPRRRMRDCDVLARALAPFREGGQAALGLCVREALPERAAWVEGVARSAAVAIGLPAAGLSDATVRADPVSEHPTAEPPSSPPQPTAAPAPRPSRAVAQITPRGEVRAPSEAASATPAWVYRAAIVGALGAIGLLALLMGLWLGSH